MKVYDKQFEEFFEHWDGVQILSRGIMCNGSLPAGPRGAPPPRLCVPAGVRVLKRIPVRSYDNLERLAPSDGAPHRSCSRSTRRSRRSSMLPTNPTTCQHHPQAHSVSIPRRERPDDASLPFFA